MGSAAVLDVNSDAGVHTKSCGGGGGGRGSAGKKRKGLGRGSNKNKSPVNIELEDSKESGGNDKLHIDSENAAETSAPRKMPRRAAACSNFKEKTVKLSEKTSTVKTKEDHLEEEETDAVQLTRLGPEDHPPCRKLVDFILHDSDGNPQPFEMSEIDDTFVTSVILPMEEELEKVKDRGVKCEGFGRIETWSISGYDEGTPVIWVSTDVADYECVKPAGSYKKFYDRFCEKAHVCIEVFKKLSRPQGGNPNLTLEELLARVARSMSGSKSFPAGPSGIDFLVSLGEFIFNQLIGLDESPENDDIKFASLPVLISLREQCRSRSDSNKLLPTKCGGSLKIDEGNHLEATEDEDEKLARLLQEEEDWKSVKQRNSRQNTASRNKFYVKINEDEIANDYPLPAYYKPSVQEMDEYIFFESDDAVFYSAALPTRVLNNWSLYNSDSRLISLELLPMKPCAETDVAIFGSGSMRDDDGSGFCLDLDPSQSHSSASAAVDVEGVPIYLSAIKEWMIEFGSSMIFISIRTDMAWYRLGKPTKQYAPWYEPVLKTARLAINIIALLKEQTRASKLSFSDVIKKVSEFDKTHPAYISSNMASVERYVVVHGQIILQQFSEYPDEMIRKSAFVIGLSEQMELRHHTKLFMKKKIVVQKETNMNPSAMMVPVQSNRKVMRATTTRLINKIWGEYYSNYLPGDSNEGQVHESKEEDELEELEENEDDEIKLEELTVIAQDNISKPHSSIKTHSSKLSSKEVKWEGASVGNMDSGWTLYRSAIVRGDIITIGGAVLVDSDTSEEELTMIFVEYMFETPNGGKMIHGRVLKKGSHTMLGNAANKREVFLTNECLEIELTNVKETVVVDIWKLPWGHKYRKEQTDADKLYQAKAEEREKKGLPVEYFCKSLYWPQRGAFFTLPFDTMGLGTGACYSCKMRENDVEEFKIKASKFGFVYKKVEYHVHDFVYVSPEQFGESKEDCGTFKSGRNVWLKAHAVCHLLEIEVPKGSKQPTPETAQVKVRRFYRPEDISAEKAYRSDIREIFYSEDILNIPVEAIEGKCEIRKTCQLPNLDAPVAVDHIFYCERSYDPEKGAVKQLPSNVKIQSSTSVNDTALKKAKGKGKCKEGDDIDSPKWKDVPKENRLSTLDIFAGCGGLSEGLQQSGVSFTKWAIEYEQPAGEAFSQNHPEALVFIDNCNVILRAIMDKCGDADECISTAEAIELAAKLDEEKHNNLPLPGEVDFINGGPPCQGFSGMNRFNQSTWSKVQCEMILAFLSFADYFRPRFFLLENVRNFVSFNKGQTFCLTLASLLEMGYQVRFGILEAGAFGVSQSRKRAFIWAASPEETLPEWPEPMYVFASPDLKVSLPGNTQYAAVHNTAGGAPFRSITVRDTIGDLPLVANGASRMEIEYGGGPVSWFQKQIRGNMMLLSDHISKEMNELNLIRCQHIPCRPGADWRDLPEKKVKLSTGQMVDLIPWCLPNTAKRHNQWKGLFGRLAWEGNFPTSITDPQPMGKVGMCFHPDQDRILTVRECARSQGFLDSYHFAGNIQNKHRQIGNAVPPPLAYALGRKLKEVVDRKRQNSCEA